MGSRAAGTPRLSAQTESFENTQAPWLRSETPSLLDSLHFLLGRQPGRSACGAQPQLQTPARNKALTPLDERARQWPLIFFAIQALQGEKEQPQKPYFTKPANPLAQGAFPSQPGMLLRRRITSSVPCAHHRHGRSSPLDDQRQVGKTQY